ncbi:DUF1800 domain-containing protein [Octadecabacter sp.]|nr:DUF1800 domain-containing protein [Octadecabacter sp.]
MARSTHTTDGFRERLTRFWADHFTVRPVSGISRHLVSPYIEEAIRPHVAGSFGDMSSPKLVAILIIRRVRDESKVNNAQKFHRDMMDIVREAVISDKMHNRCWRVKDDRTIEPRGHCSARSGRCMCAIRIRLRCQSRRAAGRT